MVTPAKDAASPDAALKSLFAQIPTAVTIVTVGTGGERYGATVGSVGALSLDPPLLMLVMKEDSTLLRRLDVGSPIGFNLLAARQHDIARRFSTPGIDRFDLTHWCEENDLPRIDDALVWIAARVRDRVRLGDHMLVTAEVKHAEIEAGAPLVYWRREFRSLAEHGTAGPDSR